MSTDTTAEHDTLQATKAAILKALKRTRAVRVTIEYDGEGDNGQIGDITAEDVSGKPVALEGKPLRQAVDAFAWDVLCAYHAGYQDNDGGFGTITIDVRKGGVTIDHNDRVIDVCNTVTEV